MNESKAERKDKKIAHSYGQWGQGLRRGKVGHDWWGKEGERGEVKARDKIQAPFHILHNLPLFKYYARLGPNLSTKADFFIHLHPQIMKLETNSSSPGSGFHSRLIRLVGPFDMQNLEDSHCISLKLGET